MINYLKGMFKAIFFPKKIDFQFHNLLNAFLHIPLSCIADEKAGAKTHQRGARTPNWIEFKLLNFVTDYCISKIL